MRRKVARLRERLLEWCWWLKLRVLLICLVPLLFILALLGARPAEDSDDQWSRASSESTLMGKRPGKAA